MALHPQRPGRLEDSEFRKEFKALMAEELLDEVTTPHQYSAERAEEIMRQFEEDNKLPMSSPIISSLFVRVCQQVRLTPDEIDQLQEEWS